MSVRRSHPIELPVAITLVVVAVAATLWQIFVSDLIEVADGCGWDGAVYCDMARNSVVMEPYSRRVLLPGVVSAFSGDDPVTGFRVVNALACAALVAAAVWLYVRLSEGSAESWACASVAALVILNPWTVHLYLTYPVLTDFASAALITAWAATVLRGGRWDTLAGFALLVALTLTREQWSLVAIGAAWLAVLLGLRRGRWALGVTLVGSAGLAFTFTRTTSQPAGPLRAVYEFWLSESLTSSEHLARLSFMVAGGLGIVSLLLVMRPQLVLRSRPVLWVCLVALANTIISVFAGGDTDRILMPSGILLLCAATACATRDVFLRPAWCLLALATVVTWHPFVTAGPDAASWLSFYGLRVTPLATVMDRVTSDAAVAGPLILAAVLSARLGSGAGWPGRPRSTGPDVTQPTPEDSLVPGSRQVAG